MIKLLQGPAAAMTLGGLSFLITTVVLLQGSLSAVPVVHEEPPADTADAFWEGHSVEVDQLLQEVRKEEAELAKKEQMLRELASRLETERAELNTVTQRVHQLQVEFDQNVVRVKEEEVANLKRLAKMYATMTPEGASSILKELDDQVVVKLFTFMKESESAPLLELMATGGAEQARRAALISEALRRTLGEKKKAP